MENDNALKALIAYTLQAILGFIVVGVVVGVPLLILLYFIS